MTATGTVHSFLLSGGKSTQPDLKLYVNADAMAAHVRPKFYSAMQVSALQTALSEARASIETVQHRSDEAIAAFKQEAARAQRQKIGARPHRDRLRRRVRSDAA